MICIECSFKREYRRGGNLTRSVICEHPNKEYIYNYFKQNNIHKMEGFLGFVNSKGVFPIKKCPKWCPLKERDAE